MGAHKAYLFGRTLVNYDVAVFSDLDPGILRKCHLRAANPAAIIEEWVSSFEGTPLKLQTATCCWIIYWARRSYSPANGLGRP